MKDLLVKLGLTLGILAAIGAALVLSSDEEKLAPEVKSAEADILSSFGEDGKEFDRAVVSLGIRPRAFDFNGNVMYFGNLVVQGDPTTVANQIQDQLVHEGVNSRNYMKERPFKKTIINHDPNRPSEDEMRDAMLIGEVVPTINEPGRIEMSGLLGPSVGEFNYRAAGFSKAEVKRGDVKYQDFVEGYRYIEVRQDGNENTSEVIAIWSDNNFSARRMEGEEGTDQSPPDPTIPACMGCKRDRRVTPLEKDEPYEINKWHTPETARSTYNFYKKAMENRGWRETGIQPKLDKLVPYIDHLANAGGRSLTLEKDGKVINITILETERGGSEVFSLERFMDAQPTLDIVQDAGSNNPNFGTDIFNKK